MCSGCSSSKEVSLSSFVEEIARRNGCQKTDLRGRKKANEIRVKEKDPRPMLVTRFGPTQKRTTDNQIAQTTGGKPNLRFDLRLGPRFECCPASSAPHVTCFLPWFFSTQLSVLAARSAQLLSSISLAPRLSPSRLGGLAA
ncbi:hypothetical protein SDJN03_14692, partial [Cucurbita argyrosperma subsp. sororia]